MEELSIEEKAKRYDELKVTAQELEHDGCFDKITLFDLFPELKESEDDRIRKALMQNLKERFGTKGNMGEGLDMPDVLAWLEKQGGNEVKLTISDEGYNKAFQDGIEEVLTNPYKYGLEKQGNKDMGISEATKRKLEDNLNKALEKETPESWNEFLDEQKSADKVEPKFKIEKGKWYICISQFCNCIEGRVYKATSDSRIIDDFGTEYDMHNDAYKYFRLWTIQDAKDGDVLVTGNKNIFIFKSISGYTIYDYCGLYFGKFEESTATVNGTAEEQLPVDYVPATKEQRDLLFQKMKEAGYEWDAEKKELKKIEQKPVERNIWKDTKKELPKADSLILAIDDLGVIRSEYYEGDGYLSKDENIKLSTHHTKWCYQSEAKEIKQPVEWSEEDDDNLTWLVEMLLGFDGNDIECYKDKKFIDKCKEVCKWLKAIKDRTFPQPKQEWSEEDEKYLIYNIEQDYKDKLNNNPPESLRLYYNKVISWLKSLKDRYTWRPSDEQLEALHTMNVTGCITEVGQGKSLVELYKQLNELRKE